MDRNLTLDDRVISALRRIVRAVDTVGANDDSKG
jgi:hypothetical protein